MHLMVETDPISKATIFLFYFNFFSWEESRALPWDRSDLREEERNKT